MKLTGVVIARMETFRLAETRAPGREVVSTDMIGSSTHLRLMGSMIKVRSTGASCFARAAGAGKECGAILHSNSNRLRHVCYAIGRRLRGRMEVLFGATRSRRRTWLLEQAHGGVISLT